MKKLTAGIFTVLVGLCAANSADAAIASKAWVEQGLGTKVSTETYATDKSTLESSIATAKKAGDDAAVALEAYKGTNDAAVKANADAIAAAEGEIDALQTTVSDETNGLVKKVADLQQGLENVQGGQLTLGADAVDGKNIKDGAVSEVKLDSALAAKVNAAQTSAQVTDAITSALADYTTTETLTADYLKKTDAATTYQTIANMTNTSVEGETAKTVYPTVALMNQSISDSVSVAAQDIVANTESITALQNALKDGGTTQTAIAAAQAQADKGVTDAAAAKAAADAAQADAAQALTDAAAASSAAAQALSDAKAYADAEDAKIEAVDAEQTTNIAANTAAIEAEVTRAKAAEAANATAAAGAQSAADAAQATANAAIPKPAKDCTTMGAKCVLTVGESGYAWESVERADGEAVQ